MGRAKYKIITCPSDDAEQLENLLNSMSKAGWDLSKQVAIARDTTIYV